MKDLTDFAVICKGVTVPQENATLRVFPVQTSLSLVDAVKGAASLIPADVAGNMPRSDAGDVLDNVISVQHRSGGYCRMVAKLVAPVQGGAGSATKAQGKHVISNHEYDYEITITAEAATAGHAGNNLRVEIQKGVSIEGDGPITVTIYNGSTQMSGQYSPDGLSVTSSDLNGIELENDAGHVSDYVILDATEDIPVSDIPAITDDNPLTIQLSGGTDGGEGDLSGINTAKGFVLAELDDAWKPVAVASIDAGIDLTKPELYVAFTFSKTNNYQSVSFSPNAFATIEDLNAINGLDGLHIAYDHMSGDIKLIDKDGKVLDQANLHMDADTIIADGEEGYKYVKTDRNQDIHSAKAFMPDEWDTKDLGTSGNPDLVSGQKTAWETVRAVNYVPSNACFLVDSFKEPAIADAMSSYVTAYSAFIEAQSAFESARATYNLRVQALAAGTEGVTQEQVDEAHAEVQEKLELMQEAQESVNAVSEAQMQTYEDIKPRIIHGESPAVVGIRVYSTTGEGANAVKTSKDYILDGTYLNKVTNANGTFLAEVAAGDSITPTPIPTLPGSGAIEEQYSPDAFVWTVGSDTGNGTASDTFAQKMNAAAQSMGFHVGDDIPLGTNIATLLGSVEGNMSASGGFDAQKYMHDGDENNYAEDLINEQRNLAKEELAAWNKQHPALIHDPLNGTRISSSGLDVRNGKIEIGNGIANDDNDSVKRYVIETDIDDVTTYDENDHSIVTHQARADKGLQIGVIASQSSTTDNETTVYTDVKKDILTINAEDYISGAPTCLALLKCHKVDDGNGSTTLSADLTETTGEQDEEVTVNVGRITANFLASGEESNGVFTLTITDMRANNGFGDVPRIVEIDPVYKNGADTTEAVPVQRSLSAIATAETNQAGHSQISVACTKVLDWAQAIDLGGTIEIDNGSEISEEPNGQELYLIVKVY